MLSIKAILVSLSFSMMLLQGATGYKVVGHYPVPGDGGFDYLTIDSSERRLYLSHGTQVDVIDADSGKFIGTIADTPGVHGIAIASEFKHGFTSNGRENKVSMFDPATLKLIKKIDVGKGPDGIYYDPATKRVFTNNHGSHDISVIDAKTGEVVGNEDADRDHHDGQRRRLHPDGKAFDDAFDPKSLEVKKRFPIGVAKVPTGLAYDAKTKRLFIGCRNEPKMVVMDATNGKVINNFPIGKGVDFAGFDPQAKLIFFSCGEGTLSIYREKSADTYEDAGAVTTQPSAKTMAFDTKTGKVFLSAAEFIETPATEPNARPQRRIKPGSFVVVVVGK